MKFKFYYYIEKKGTGTVEADTMEEAQIMIEESVEQRDEIVYNDDEKVVGFQICEIVEGGWADEIRRDINIRVKELW